MAYSGTQGNALRYQCQGAHLNHGTERCISFGGLRVDEAVGREVLRVLGPFAMQAALRAIDARERRSGEVLHQAELALEAARFEERRARRQYDAVDPDNRLVAGELERRWNEGLSVVRQREQTVSQLRQRVEHDALSANEREEYLALGADLERAWTHERASPESRKRIVRAVLMEIVATVQGNRILLRLHWQGGDHTELTVRKNRPGHHRWTTDAETGALIAQLVRVLPDRSIASLLSRLGKTTGKGNRRTEARVRGYRNSHGVAVHRDHRKPTVPCPRVAPNLQGLYLCIVPTPVLERDGEGLVPASLHPSGVNELPCPLDGAWHQGLSVRSNHATNTRLWRLPALAPHGAGESDSPSALPRVVDHTGLAPGGMPYSGGRRCAHPEAPRASRLVDRALVCHRLRDRKHGRTGGQSPIPRPSLRHPELDVLRV